MQATSYHKRTRTPKFLLFCLSSTKPHPILSSEQSLDTGSSLQGFLVYKVGVLVCLHHDTPREN